QAIGDRVAGTDKRGIIRIRSRRLGSDAVIAISDDGGGIPAAIHDRIFDPFFTTKPVGKGTGQGLAIARAVIMDAHVGDLSFDTLEGAVATFTIRIPIEGKAAATRATSGV